MSNNPGASNISQARSAPWYPVADREIVSVEHPCVVQNLDKGLATLGGNDPISHVAKSHRTEDSLPLRLNPDDVMSRSTHSTCSSANDVLLKVTVPRWTGRKRKRGTNGPFVDASPEEQAQAGDARHRVRSLRDNVGKYSVQAVGSINRTHVFRAMPDFVFSTTASPFVTRFREKILPFDYEKLKQFGIDMTKGTTKNADLVPPPSFSRSDVPFQYSYRQNYSVRRAVNSSGKVTTVNIQQIPKISTRLVSYNVPSVPTSPSEACQPLEQVDQHIQEVVETLRGLLADRPAYTRRALRNQLKNKDQQKALRYSIPYVAYVFRSGPWRDAVVRFGYDPRVELDSWVYQTFMFRMMSSADDDNGGESDTDKKAAWSSQSGLPPTSAPSWDTVGSVRTPNRRPVEKQTADSHIFTGHPPLPLDGKIWMVCDIHDGLLRRILYNLDGRFPKQPVCDIMSVGWYGNVTHAVARVIMRAKFESMLEGRKRNFALDDSTFEPLLSFPTHIDNEMDLVTKIPTERLQSSRCTLFATEVRRMIRVWIQQKQDDKETGALGGLAEGAENGRDSSQYRQRGDDAQSDGDFEEEDEREAEAEAEAMEDAD